MPQSQSAKVSPGCSQIYKVPHSYPLGENEAPVQRLHKALLCFPPPHYRL